MTNKTLIQPIKKELTIDNSTTLLSNFWEKNFSHSPFSYNPCNQVIELIKKAQKTIVVYSPYIIHHQIQRELELASKKNIRLYSISKNLERHERAFSKGIMREKPDIDSSFVIIDHQETSKKGIWFSGEINSQSIPQPSIQLNSIQISGLMHQFNHFFWHSQSRELYNGKIINAKTRKPEFNKKPPEYRSVLRYDRISHYLNNENLLELWIDDSYPTTLQYLWPEAHKIVFAISETLKQSDIPINIEVMGHFTLPFSYIKTQNNAIVYRKDLGIILTAQQTSNLEQEMNPFPWQYNSSKPYSDIYNALILPDSTWNESNPQKIQNKININLPDFTPNTILDWQKELEENNHPSISNQRHLSKTITYNWILKPPSLPKYAKKSDLYQQWSIYISNVNTIKTKLIDLISQILSQNELRENTQVMKISEPLTGIKIDPMDYTSSSQVTPIIESAQKSLLQILTPLRISYNKKKNEMEIFSNKIQSIYDQLTSLSPLKLTRPSLPIPRTGTLYQHNNIRYLTIEYIEDISKAEKIKNRYNAKIVVNYE